MIDPIRVARFWSKVSVIDDEFCWEWKACIGANGYGHFKIGRTPLGAHVVAYKIIKGEIPKGMLVCHSCDNPKCCNPNHLWLGTVKDNARDKIAKGRDKSFGKSAQKVRISKISKKTMAA